MTIRPVAFSLSCQGILLKSTGRLKQAYLDILEATQKRAHGKKIMIADLTVKDPCVLLAQTNALYPLLDKHIELFDNFSTLLHPNIRLVCPVLLQHRLQAVFVVWTGQRGQRQPEHSTLCR